MLFFIFIVLIIMAYVSCLSDSNKHTFVEDGEIIIISEEIINEFKDDEKVAFEKYKYKKFQMSGEIYTIYKSIERGYDLPVFIWLFDNDCFFDFKVDFKVNNKYPPLKPLLKRGDKIIIQGFLTKISKETENFKKMDRKTETYCFFEQSKFIGIIGDEAEVNSKKSDSGQGERP